MLWTILGGVLLFLALVVLYDVTQRRHAILRNFPIIGHFRYILESVGPELRQYIVTNNAEERPFSRDQRRWVYASAKRQNNYFGFGTGNDLETAPNYLIIKPAVFPYREPLPGDEDYDSHHNIACAKVLGGARGRKKAFRPDSVFYVSGMSYGSLSGPAVEALNRGCALSKSLQNTGEGSISRHHDHGGSLIWQLGTGYFGARDKDGKFSLEELIVRVQEHKVSAIEIKLSQGAKPGRGGVLPAEKITAEIAQIRGIPMGKDCISPSSHSAFSTVDELLDFVETIADATGLPVGIKSAVGDLSFWIELADKMVPGERGVDFIAIDGGEGGTGAAPLVFADNVALPFKLAFSRVYKIFSERNLHEKVVFMGTGRLGFPENALLAFAMGVDMVGVAREAMLAIGCIQAQNCHTGHCPAGVATQNRWLMRGLDPTDKSARMANYMVTLRKEVMWLTRAVGVAHPSQVNLDHFEIIDECFSARSAREIFGYPAFAPQGQEGAAPLLAEPEQASQTESARV
ncbi:FMN-binding glutamate synthase family protein [Lujinxingia litoralis]|uniref:FMN-binding glutamate synthase family protein n=1 Tax=Lujinxingia litoralis TaxID=2211119 RepID=A0A328C9U5_9DELT|nr:FMN-binding glutamate synthase family protein [Lujinxingia litoralis]RAL22393.1 FMN-binding glutamate synthase family protein [Lujinxingia litoralis]